MPALLSISQAAALAAHLQPGQQSVVPPARYSSLNASSSSEGLLLVGQTAVKVLHLQQPDIAAVRAHEPASRGPACRRPSSMHQEAAEQQQGASWQMQRTTAPEEVQVASKVVAARQEEAHSELPIENLSGRHMKAGEGAAGGISAKLTACLSSGATSCRAGSSKSQHPGTVGSWPLLVVLERTELRCEAAAQLVKVHQWLPEHRRRQTSAVGRCSMTVSLR